MISSDSSNTILIIEKYFLIKTSYIIIQLNLYKEKNHKMQLRNNIDSKIKSRKCLSLKRYSNDHIMKKRNIHHKIHDYQN